MTVAWIVHCSLSISWILFYGVLIGWSSCISQDCIIDVLSLFCLACGGYSLVFGPRSVWDQCICIQHCKLSAHSKRGGGSDEPFRTKVQGNDAGTVFLGNESTTNKTSMWKIITTKCNRLYNVLDFGLFVSQMIFYIFQSQSLRAVKLSTFFSGLTSHLSPVGIRIGKQTGYCRKSSWGSLTASR